MATKRKQPSCISGAQQFDSSFEPELEARSEYVTIFMVRHGQRIDETDEGRQWQLQAGDRWYDPPLTDEGKLQASTAAQQLIEYLRDSNSSSHGDDSSGGGQPANGRVQAAEKQNVAPNQEVDEFEPFATVYCSPLLRTLSTAAEFGRVMGIPVAPVAGLATCTAVFRKHGAAQQVLLPFEAVKSQCTHAELMPFDTNYGTARFEDTVARLAQETADACHRQQRQRQAQPASVENRNKQACTAQQQQPQQMQQSQGQLPCGSRRRRIPAVVIVTHREGLRNTSQLTFAPFHKTKYCCTAVFKYRLHPEPKPSGGDGSRGNCSRTPSPSVRWSLAHSPEAFELLQRRLRIRRKVAETERCVGHEDFEIIKHKLALVKARQWKAWQAGRGGNQRTEQALADEQAMLEAQLQRAAAIAAVEAEVANGHALAGRPAPVVDWNADGEEISEPPVLLESPPAPASVHTKRATGDVTATGDATAAGDATATGDATGGASGNSGS